MQVDNLVIIRFGIGNGHGKLVEGYQYDAPTVTIVPFV
jgi:hypothetical protein